MKLLFDQNLSFKLCRLLADAFPESNQIRSIGLEESEDRAKVIWLRCGNQPTDGIEQRLRNHAEAIAAFVKDEAAACWEIY